MIDIFVWEEEHNGETVHKYAKIEKSITDVTMIPSGAPPDVSLISANDWHTLVNSYFESSDPDNEKPFDQREAEYIDILGLVLA
jgi:hypothetical protein